MANSGDNNEIIEKDYRTLFEKFEKLEFIDDVAFYFDENATQRKIHYGKSTLDEWIFSFSESNSIYIEYFIEFVHEVSMVIKSYLNEPSNYNEQIFYSQFQSNFKKLKNWPINSDILAYNKFVNDIMQYNQPDNNYSLVTKDKRFLMDKHYMVLPHFYHAITINDYGLFELERRELSNNYNEPKSFSLKKYIYIWDTKINYLREENFCTLIKILSNRRKCYSPTDFVKIIPSIKAATFPIVNWESGLWRDKKGEEGSSIQSIKSDGLFIFEEQIGKRDSSNYILNIKDEFNNSMTLCDFYHGMLMLENGRNFQNKLNLRFLNKLLPL